MATTNSTAADVFAQTVADRIAAQLAAANTGAPVTQEQSAGQQATTTYQNTTTVQTFQNSLDQYSLTKVDVQDGQLESPTLTNPTLLGTTFAPTPTRGATDNEIATAEFVAQAITDTLTGLGSIVPVGTIAMWSGTLEMTPAGWQVCDGTNGTPDLRGRFVLGANSTITTGTTGGTANAVIVTHTHTFSATSGDQSQSHNHSISISDPGHTHTIPYTGNVLSGGAVAIEDGSVSGSYTIPNNTTGITASAGNASQGHTHLVSGTTANATDGVTGTDKNLPPYYALYYIMKLLDVAVPSTSGQLYIDTTNNRIGVGLTTPSVLFEVAGASKFTGTVASGNTTITGFANVSTTLQVGGNTQIASLGIGTAASGTAGEIRATNNITAYYSDDRFKTRLGNIENALDKIDQLSGFYYEANELAQSYGYEKIREVGVSAQDTQKVFGEIVAPAPVDDRYLTVRYEKFAPLLIEGIKELRVELNKIKTHLNI